LNRGEKEQGRTGRDERRGRLCDQEDQKESNQDQDLGDPHPLREKREKEKEKEKEKKKKKEKNKIKKEEVQLVEAQNHPFLGGKGGELDRP